MKQEARIVSAGRQSSLTRLTLVATVLVFGAYAVVLAVARQLSLAQALPASLANTIPVVGFGVIAYRIVETRLVGRSRTVQVVGHAVLCMTYAILAYWLLIVLLGAATGASVVQFIVEPFSMRGWAFQLLQNVTTYGIIATLAYRGRGEGLTVVLGNDADTEPAGLSRYFIRSGEDIKPIDVNSIVSIAGADDYAEVRTIAGPHLVRMTLAEFEKSLDPGKFIRVHRSRIVNFERIVRAEPAGGGRLLLHMEDGEAITASRAGSRLLRERVL